MEGAVGVLARDRTAIIGGRGAMGAGYKDAEREIEEIDAKLNVLTTQRSVAQADAAISACPAEPVMSGERHPRKRLCGQAFHHLHEGRQNNGGGVPWNRLPSATSALQLTNGASRCRLLGGAAQVWPANEIRLRFVARFLRAVVTDSHALAFDQVWGEPHAGQEVRTRVELIEGEQVRSHAGRHHHVGDRHLIIIIELIVEAPKKKPAALSREERGRQCRAIGGARRSEKGKSGVGRNAELRESRAGPRNTCINRAAFAFPKML